MKNNKYQKIKYYECYLDGKTFNNEKEYVTHFKNCHPDDYPFYCYNCQKGFYSKMAIKNHNKMKKHHKKDSIYKNRII